MLMKCAVIVFYFVFIAVKSSSLTHIRNSIRGEEDREAMNDELTHFRRRRFPNKKLAADAHPNKYKDNLWDPLGEADKGKDVLHVPCPKRKFNVLSKDVKANVPFVDGYRRDKVTRDLFKNRFAKGHQNESSQELKQRQQWLIFSSQEKSPNVINYGVQESEQQTRYKGANSNALPGMQSSNGEAFRGPQQLTNANVMGRHKFPKDKFGYNTQTAKNSGGAAPSNFQPLEPKAPHPFDEQKYQSNPSNKSADPLNPSWTLQNPGQFPVPGNPLNQNNFMTNFQMTPPNPKSFFPSGMNLGSEYPNIQKLLAPNNTFMEGTQLQQHIKPMGPPKMLGSLPGPESRPWNVGTNSGSSNGGLNSNSGSVGSNYGSQDGRNGHSNSLGFHQSQQRPMNGIDDLKSNATKHSLVPPKPLTAPPTLNFKTPDSRGLAEPVTDSFGGNMEVFNNVKKNEQMDQHKYLDPLKMEARGRDEQIGKKSQQTEPENKMDERKGAIVIGQGESAIMRAPSEYGNGEDLVNHIVRNDDNQMYCCHGHVHNGSMCGPDCQCQAGLYQSNIVNEKCSRTQENASNPLKHVLEPPVVVEANMFTNSAHKVVSKVPFTGDVTYRPFHGFAPARNDETFYDKNMHFLGRIVHPPLVNVKRGENPPAKSRVNGNKYHKWYPRDYPADYLSEPVDFHSDMRMDDFPIPSNRLRKARKCLKGRQNIAPSG